MNLKTCCLAVAAVCLTEIAFAAATQELYSSPGYMLGIFNRNNESAMTKTPTTPALIFPGATLAELDECVISGWAGSGSMSSVGEAEAIHRHPYYNGQGQLEFLATAVQKLDDRYVKASIVKLTDGPGGVWGQELGVRYSAATSANWRNYDFVTVGADGGITLNGTSYSYNFYALAAMKWVPVQAPRLFFGNPAGEATLTVDDLKNYRFTGIVSGGSVSPNKYQTVDGQNKYVTYDPDTGKATKIRLEMQVMDDRYLKCPVVELTDGEGGVYAQTVGAYYVTVSGDDAWVAIGYPFLDEFGAVNMAATVTETAKADGPFAGGYGVAGLKAIAVNEAAYTLSESTTWSALTGSSAPIANDKLQISLEVTGENPTLTFDVPITANSLLVSSSAGRAVTFALAAGTERPVFDLWNLLGTTGNVTFNGFSPVTDSATDNIRPNLASTLTFLGSTQGFLPFNDTPVALPCAGVVLGGGATLNAFRFNKLRSVTIQDGLTLNGNVTGTGELTFVGDASVTLTESLTTDASVSFVLPEAPVPVHTTAEGPVSFKVTAEQVTGGPLTFEGGTFAVRFGQESYPVVGAGATLAITVDDYCVHAGYTSPAQLVADGTIRFYTEAGEEVGVGRPLVNVLPRADLLWKPLPEGENAFSSQENWSSGMTPAGGDVLVSDDGLAEGATAHLVENQSYDRITIANGAKIVFAADGGTLSASTLLVGEGATVEIPLAAVDVVAVEVMSEATLIVRGDETERTFETQVSGAGRVVFAGGQLVVASQNTYTGGTRIADGAYVKNAGARVNVPGIGNCGSFGKMYTRVTVDAGATLDENGLGDANYDLTLAGSGVVLADGTTAGALCNSGGECHVGYSQFLSVSLAADATVRVDDGHLMGIIPPGYGANVTINLGEYTLTKVGGGTLYIVSNVGVTMPGTGTLRIEEGHVNFLSKSDSTGIAGAEAHLETVGTGVLDLGIPATLAGLANGGTLNYNSAGRDFTVAAVYTGDGEVHKWGVNCSAWVPLNNGSKSVFTVHEGRLCANKNAITRISGNPYAFNTEEEPAANQKIIVVAGAEFDIDGTPDITPHVVVAGRLWEGAGYGAFANRGSSVGNGSLQIPQLTVVEEAWVGGKNGDYGLLAPSYQETRLELGTNTLHVAAEDNRNFWLVNTGVYGTGCVRVDSGTLFFHKNPTAGADWTLDVTATGKVQLNAACTVSNLVFAGTAAGDAVVTATGTYTPGEGVETLPNVVLNGDGAAIDIGAHTTPWNIATGGGLTFGVGTKVVVRTGERTLAAGTQLLAWSEIPTNVAAWKLDSTSGNRLKATARTSGLFATPTASVIYIR